jgi:hypothetical protein
MVNRIKAAGDGQQAERPVEEEDRGEEDRRPGRVEEGEGRRAGQGALDRLEIAQAAAGLSALVGGDGAAQRRFEHPSVEQGLEPRAGAGEHAGADMVQQPHDEKQRRDQQEQRRQRRLGPAGEHAVIDLQHEQRPGQHQQVDEYAEERDAIEKAS